MRDRFGARNQARVAIVAGATLTASVLVVGAGPVAAQDGSLAECLANAEPMTYGYIKPGPDTWYQRDVDGFVYAAEADGNEVVVLDTEYDSEKELAEHRIPGQPGRRRDQHVLEHRGWRHRSS